MVCVVRKYFVFCTRTPSHNTIKDIATVYKSRPAYNMVIHRIKPNSSGFSEIFEVNIKKTYRPILLDHFCFINLWNKIISPKLRRNNSSCLAWRAWKHNCLLIIPTMNKFILVWYSSQHIEEKSWWGGVCISYYKQFCRSMRIISKIGQESVDS